jgi:amidase
MKANRLDALLFPGTSSASIAAKPGYPTVFVPYGFAEPGGAGRGAGAGPGGAAAAGAPAEGGRGESAWPEGFSPKPSPTGVSFTGMACGEPKLIEVAYAFEQATKKRVPPKL